MVQPTDPAGLTSDQAGLRWWCERCNLAFGHPDEPAPPISAETLAAIDRTAQRVAQFADLTDLAQRLKLLRAASRPKEPLTDAGGPTIQGCIASAISKLEREITRRRMG